MFLRNVLQEQCDGGAKYRKERNTQNALCRDERSGGEFLRKKPRDPGENRCESKLINGKENAVVIFAENCHGNHMHGIYNAAGQRHPIAETYAEIAVERYKANPADTNDGGADVITVGARLVDKPEKEWNKNTINCRQESVFPRSCIGDADCLQQICNKEEEPQQPALYDILQICFL